ncbi:hypothetical protein FHS18_005585 [Paenibacillus phyllosphaerae]|uniref:Uncharacterized protein n=1 Tax=Paenibacillus phyllosphaerae TaxID=274593 RepID=A0A7W5FQN4_9BACL|nr:hypothetical protein [Paenibacillus phyllosphaerae]MBB3113473.1 hypothetical protein [Paenibacillus phyllosphaerae]
MKKSIIGAAMLTSLVVFISAAYAVGEDYKPVQQTPETQTVFVTGVSQANGTLTLTTDAIDWYEGTEADRVFLEREPDSGLDATPDGYYIVNDDEQAKAYPVDPKAEVLMQIYDHTGNIEELDTNWNETITLDKFASIFPNSDILDLSQFPYHLTITDGVVTKIVQQYIP